MDMQRRPRRRVGRRAARARPNDDVGDAAGAVVDELILKLNVGVSDASMPDLELARHHSAMREGDSDPGGSDDLLVHPLDQHAPSPSRHRRVSANHGGRHHARAVVDVVSGVDRRDADAVLWHLNRESQARRRRTHGARRRATAASSARRDHHHDDDDVVAAEFADACARRAEHVWRARRPDGDDSLPSDDPRVVDAHHASRGGVYRASARFGGKAGSSEGVAPPLLRACLRALRRAFLPEGYPRSVSSDYLAFQLCDAAQGVCSYARGILCSTALLRGAGVGSSTATAASATAQFVARDLTSMLGGVAFAATRGRAMDADAKRWRLFADAMNDLGMAIELASPAARAIAVAAFSRLVAGGGGGGAESFSGDGGGGGWWTWQTLGRFGAVSVKNEEGVAATTAGFGGDYYFLVAACLGGLARSLCGVTSRATRAALTQHFAAGDDAGRSFTRGRTGGSTTGSVADVDAKEGTQETAATLIGMGAGVLVTRLAADDAAAIWFWFALLTALHVFFNVRAMRSLRLNTMNRVVVRILLRRFRWHRERGGGGGGGGEGRGRASSSASEHPHSSDDDDDDAYVGGGAGAVAAIGEGVMSIAEVSAIEPLLPRGFRWMFWPWSLLTPSSLPFTRRRRRARLAAGDGEGGGVVMGSRLSSASDARSAVVVANALSEATDDAYLIFREEDLENANGRRRTRRMRTGASPPAARVRVVLRRGATPADELRAYAHACLLAGAAAPAPPPDAPPPTPAEERRASRETEAGMSEEEAARWMRDVYPSFIAGCEARGWDVGATASLASEGARLEWGADASADAGGRTE
ncbi:uncharacterized protein MICPUCDRAFT_59618 [Micromonas pusilla CCMP1545]|uniref:Predicted protein n=1 Tax=Micromonas pusilla (strain CCMP1545) TaxID=564608 RepID=C1MW42_MICPC|nr:uncharacterized protein MICPUCDRAFT_59618 [Micromonas pusilla CCMP1545]EEH56103.1 predicted protein [Micromonas pusilla CCMP1545]|eukprot:XP_003060151.1 predicted protein [Micromonas pusilla CCMP1545]